MAVPTAEAFVLLIRRSRMWKVRCVVSPILISVATAPPSHRIREAIPAPARVQPLVTGLSGPATLYVPGGTNTVPAPAAAIALLNAAVQSRAPVGSAPPDHWESHTFTPASACSEFHALSRSAVQPASLTTLFAGGNTSGYVVTGTPPSSGTSAGRRRPGGPLPAARTGSCCHSRAAR